eukprot:858002-Pelagomonas_calceolata.AAC.5
MAAFSSCTYCVHIHKNEALDVRARVMIVRTMMLASTTTHRQMGLAHENSSSASQIGTGA